MVETYVGKANINHFLIVYATRKKCKFGVDPTVLATLPQNYKFLGGR